jgi:hypothetical protein
VLTTLSCSVAVGFEWFEDGFECYEVGLECFERHFVDHFCLFQKRLTFPTPNGPENATSLSFLSKVEFFQKKTVLKRPFCQPFSYISKKVDISNENRFEGGRSGQSSMGKDR